MRLVDSPFKRAGQRPLLGRYPGQDPRSFSAHPMSAVLEPAPIDFTVKRVWTAGPLLDQGQTGHCVAFGTTEEINATPVTDDLTSDEAHAFFQLVKAQDEAMGNYFTDGATVLAGMKAAAAEGRISRYVWGSTVDDLVRWLQRKGPCVLGTNWYEDMFTPDAAGRIRPSGAYAGGHCYLALGYWPAGRLTGFSKAAIEFQQSWGPDWGKWGHFFMTLPDVATLLGQYGDLVSPTDIRPVAAG